MGEEVQTVKKQRIANAPETQSVEAGTVTDRSYSFTGTGLAINSSRDVKELQEDQMFPETAWALRNYGGAVSGSKKVPKSIWKKHFPNARGVEFDMTSGEYRPVYDRNPRSPWEKAKRKYKRYKNVFKSWWKN